MDQRADDLHQSIEATRQDIEETRISMTEKLELLEERVRGTLEGTKSAVEDIVENVKGTVDETVEAVKETVDGAKSTVENIVENVKDTMDDTVTKVKQSFDLHYQVNQHPWLMLGGSVLLGSMMGSLLHANSASRRYSSYSYDEHIYAEPHVADTTGGTGPYTITGEDGSSDSSSTYEQGSAQAQKRTSRQSVVNRFHEEFDTIRNVIIGALMGTLREMIRQNMPNLAPHLEKAITSASHKLGAEPISPEMNYESEARNKNTKADAPASTSSDPHSSTSPSASYSPRRPSGI